MNRSSIVCVTLLVAARCRSRAPRSSSRFRTRRRPPRVPPLPPPPRAAAAAPAPIIADKPGMAPPVVPRKPAAAAPAAATPAVTTATWWGHAAWVIQTPGGASDRHRSVAGQPVRAQDRAAQGARRDPGHARPRRSRRQRRRARQEDRRQGDHVVRARQPDRRRQFRRDEHRRQPRWSRTPPSTSSRPLHSGGFGQDKAGPKYGGPAMGFVIADPEGAGHLSRRRHRRVRRDGA